jgi:beta-glucanase (GH16 family)
VVLAAWLAQAAWIVPGAVAAEATAGPAALAVAGKPTAPLPGYELVWADEFDGSTLDTNKWAYRTDSKHLSTQKRENVSVGSGMLHLALKKESAGGKGYTGAGVVSVPAFKYGYYEACFKVPATPGWHTTFWLMKHDGSGTTDSGDALQGLNVVENNSVNPRAYLATVQKYNPQPPVVYAYETIRSPDLSADFHVFGCEFTPQTVKFFLDSALVQTVDATKFPHSDQNIWLSAIASHLGGTTAVDDTGLPAVVECDYIRFFAKPAAASATR